MMQLGVWPCPCHWKCSKAYESPDWLIQDHPRLSECNIVGPGLFTADSTAHVISAVSVDLSTSVWMLGGRIDCWSSSVDADYYYYYYYHHHHHHHHHYYYPRDATLARVPVIAIATCPSARPSVCPSVRHASVLCQNEES